MLARVATALLDGLDAQPAVVEVDVRPGLPSFTVLDLPAGRSAELRLHIQTALMGQGSTVPARRITVQIAPRRLTGHRDLATPVAIALLAATGQCPSDPLATTTVLGDLTMLGRLDPVRDSLQRTELAATSGHDTVLLPAGNLEEACCVPDLRLLAAPDLHGAIARLSTPVWNDRPPVLGPRPLPSLPLQLHDVPASQAVKRSLGWAVARRASVLLRGRPERGQRLLARAATEALGPLLDQERLEVTRIHSAAGFHDGYGATLDRPFRAPHPTTNHAGLLGTWGQLGELTLAHHGVLFLEDVHAYPVALLRELIATIRDGEVIHRDHERARRCPARPVLIATTRPCPCGQGPDMVYACTPAAVREFEHRHRQIAELFDVEIPLPHLP